MLGELRLTRGKKKSIGFVGFFGVSLIYSVWFSQALLCTAFHASVLWVLILPLYSRKCGQVISQESPALQARLNFGLTEARKCFFFVLGLYVCPWSPWWGAGKQTQQFLRFILL